MMYFLIFILMLFGIYAFDYRKHSRGDLVYFWVICLLCIAVAGLRYRIGGDSVVYEQSYKTLPTMADLPTFKFNSVRYEPGYVVFASIARSFSSDFTYFQILHAFAVNLVVFWFVLKNTTNKYIALSLYFLGLYLNLNTEVLREALAVCCFLLAWPFFRDGKWIFYYIFAFLALSFHLSGGVMLFFPLFVLPGIRYCFRFGWQTLVICIVIFAVGLTMQKMFFGFIEKMSDNQSIIEKAQLYSKSHFGGSSLNIIGMLDHSLKTIIFPLAALWYMRYKIKTEGLEKDVKRFRRLEIIIITGVYFATLAMPINIAGRFNNYIALFNYTLIASCFFTWIWVKRRKFRLQAPIWAMIFVVIAYFNIKVYFASVGNSSYKTYMIYYPYASRIDNQDDNNREAIMRLLIHIR